MARDESVQAQMMHSRQTVELASAESWQLLAGVSLGRIVFNRHAMPAIRPVNHLVEDETIIIRPHLGAAIVAHALVRPGEAGDLVPGTDELADDGGPDESARPGNKHAHDVTPFADDVMALAWRAVARGEGSQRCCCTPASRRPGLEDGAVRDAARPCAG